MFHLKIPKQKFDSMPLVLFVLVAIEIPPPVCIKTVKYLYLFEKQLGSGRRERDGWSLP